MIKQAVILAAGKGNRMKHGSNNPLINSVPKPLLEIDGVPIIRRIIESLDSDHIHVAVVINPVDQEIFNEKLNGLRVQYYYQHSPKGTADALYSAKNFIKSKMFGVFMGDDIFNYNDLNLKDITYPTIFTYQHYECRDFGTIELDREGYVKKILEKEHVGKGLINTGIYIMPRQFFQIFHNITVNPVSNEYYLTDAIPILYQAGYKMRIKTISRWKGINFPVDFIDANEFYNNKPILRLARIEDLSSLVGLLGQLKFYSVDQYYDFSKGENILSGIIEDENFYMLVAEIDKKIVGTATMLIQRNLTHNGRPYAHIENVVTDSSYRKRGIGKMLLSELIKVAKNLDCYKVILNCSTENSKFYKSIGFELTNETEMRMVFE